MEEEADQGGAPTTRAFLAETWAFADEEKELLASSVRALFLKGTSEEEEDGSMRGEERGRGGRQLHLFANRLFSSHHNTTIMLSRPSFFQGLLSSISLTHGTCSFHKICSS